MYNSSDDLPHPVPPIAYMRWKENYFFITMDAERDVFGIIHISTEPIFNRMRFNVNFNIAGKSYRSLRESPYPKDLAFSHVISDGQSRLTIEESHKSFRFESAFDDFALDLRFLARFPSFDFAACRYAAPDLPSFREVHGLGANLPFEHLQQAMTVAGTVQSGQSTINVDGLGYRDHSWCFRTDNVVLDHTWCGFNFPDAAIGVMTLRTLMRPGVRAAEGYIADGDGVRPLARIDVEVVGRFGAYEKVVHSLADVYGTTITIESDVRNRIGDVPLHVETSNETEAVYRVAENFCHSVIRETGVKGIALIELGETTLSPPM